MAICSFIFKRLYSSGKPCMFGFFFFFNFLSSDYKIFFLFLRSFLLPLCWADAWDRQPWSQKWEGGRCRTSAKNAEADANYPEVALGICTAPRGWGGWQPAAVQDAAIWTPSSSGSSHPTAEHHSSGCAAGHALPGTRRHGQPAGGMADGQRMNPCLLWNKLQ